MIDAEAGQTCNSAKEQTLTWKDGSTLLGKTEKAADADKLDGLDSTSFARFAGRVKFDGEVGAGSGFTSEKQGTGRYLVRFPAGTFEGCHFPIITVTAFTNFDHVIADVNGLSCTGDGGAAVNVRIETAGGSAEDATFMFFAA